MGGGIKGTQPGELEPESWHTDEGHPFGKALWFYGGPDKNGTNTDSNTENTETISENEMWSRLYCAIDGDLDTCASLCETTRPVVMWYTGIIEEE